MVEDEPDGSIGFGGQANTGSEWGYSEEEYAYENEAAASDDDIEAEQFWDNLGSDNDRVNDQAGDTGRATLPVTPGRENATLNGGEWSKSNYMGSELAKVQDMEEKAHQL